MLADQPLATFVDRHTMTFERVYPHPIERVWEAVTTAAHLEAWLLPETRVESRLGGACAFGWGGPADAEEASKGTVTAYDEPTRVTYTFTDGSWMRFDLAGVEGEEGGEGEGTRLSFTLFFRPRVGPIDADDFPGGDYPAPGTAWQPGFLAGFHEMLDQLDGFLAGSWTRADNDTGLAAFVTDGPPAEHLGLIERYREHVRATCPPG